MSRWSPDLLTVRVSAEVLHLGLFANNDARQWSIGMVREQNASVSSHCWCRSLDTALQQLQGRAVRIEVIVQSSWARYCLVPWNADFISNFDRISFAQHCFAEKYGEVARSWRAQPSLPAYGATAIAAALDCEMLDGLTTSAAKARYKITSIRPELSERVERARRSLKGETFWFVLVDSVNYSLLLIHAGSPALVQVAGRHEGPLETLLERAWRASGLEQQRCRVYVDFGGSAASDLGDSRLGWQIERLPAAAQTQGVNLMHALSGED